MSELLNQALGKGGISSVDEHLFQGLPRTRDDVPLWNKLENSTYNNLSFLELKNARCRQPGSKYIANDLLNSAKDSITNFCAIFLSLYVIFIGRDHIF